MRTLLLCALMLAPTAGALAQATSPLYVVTYLELRPEAAAQGAALLRDHRQATRRDDGNLRAEALRHATRAGQFVFLSAWRDQAAYDAHAASARAKQVREQLQALRNSPADDRFHVALSVGPLEDGAAARGPWAVTHVDVIPPRKDDAVGMLRQLGEASRKDAGNLRYEIVQQTNRPNHFTVIEAWSAREAFDAHGAAAHVREFRDRLQPMSGALYDERLFEALD